MKTYYTWLIFYVFLPAMSLGFAFIPITQCLLGNFPKEMGKVTGIVTATFGLATFFYNTASTLYVNPHNIGPTRDYHEGKQLLKLFSLEVSGRVSSLTFVFGCVYAVFLIPGAWLTKSHETIKEEKRKKLEQNGLGASANELELELELMKPEGVAGVKKAGSNKGDISVVSEVLEV